MPQAVPDLVIRNARVFGDAAREASAVAVTGDRITALGPDAEASAGPGTRVVDAAGGLLLPGFQDVHAPFAGLNLGRVWLNDDHSRQAYLRRVADYAATHPGREWIVGGGWAMEHFPGGAPSKEDLDAVVPDRPVFLMNRDMHGAWANSRALELGGITAATPDPADGRYERGPDGTPTGALHQGAAYGFDARVVPRPDADAWREAVLAAQAHLHALGITGWQDAWVTPDSLAAYRELGMMGQLTARVVGALWWDRHRGLEQLDDLIEQRETGAANGFHPSTVKIMADGVLENFTGALLDPYCGCAAQHGTGLSYVDRELLLEAVPRLAAERFQMHLHAIGDRAVRDVLDALEAAAPHDRDLRHTVAHLQLIHPDDLPRFAKLGVVANLQAYWAQHEPQMDELTMPFLGPERAGRQYPFADLAASGARLAMGSDWSVTTADPLAQLEVAITRTDPARRGSEPFLPAQALDPQTAITAFTAGSAYVNHDDDAGRIAVGARADLALLDHDITRPGALPTDATVTLTVASGRVVHDRS
ncbi:amidohydrolase [Flexivirga sp. ID2601S]|uniref:Amidohydrolase n=1 Tax=Flexivirga aerilata TaxID=1656889 RepID=A0A849AGY5_9MICO|nr:amidohydrolase [Flexivirga aerilata]NNG37690.1 amidohydrolase [Flexivirga aerilata]